MYIRKAAGRLVLSSRRLFLCSRLYSRRSYHSTDLFKSISAEKKQFDAAAAPSNNSRRQEVNNNENAIENNNEINEIEEQTQKCENDFEIKHLLLNRKKQLNALTSPMCAFISEKLLEYEKDDDVVCTVLQSSLAPRVFCAGGDVLALYKVVKERSHGWAKPVESDNEDDITTQFFQHEYRMNYLIARVRKPFVPICDGLTFGGGVGISAHSPYCVVTEHTIMGMPEMNIGFFPDVGATYLLNKIQQHPDYHGLGTFLALSGYRLRGADAVHAGLARYAIPSGLILQLIERLQCFPYEDQYRHPGEMTRMKANPVEAILQEHSSFHISSSATMDTFERPSVPDVVLKPFAPFSLQPFLPVIRNCFHNQPSISAIMKAMDREKASTSDHSVRAFIDQVMDNMNRASPMSMKVANQYMLLHSESSLPLDECLRYDYRIAQRIINGYMYPNEDFGDDFNIGIHHTLVMKERERPPEWHPAPVIDSSVRSIFKALPPEQELQLSPMLPDSSTHPNPSVVHLTGLSPRDSIQVAKSVHPSDVPLHELPARPTLASSRPSLDTHDDRDPTSRSASGSPSDSYHTKP
eukprot:TRINITY_DN7412_c0_g1_i1.p1 TRINITY_DN7412_c0_g1~~TRINITY_DN7412_c0_g1_i1.p1  ORF type:complete len:580 (+),score=104.80 TRINITY_DN7412_c0_g1_i1:35-1774(+)